MQAHGALEEAEEASAFVGLVLNPRAMLEASGLRKRMAQVNRKASLLRELCKLFVLEARDNPRDSAYLLACAKDIYRRFKEAGGI